MSHIEGFSEISVLCVYLNSIILQVLDEGTQVWIKHNFKNFLKNTEFINRYIVGNFLLTTWFMNRSYMLLSSDLGISHFFISFFCIIEYNCQWDGKRETAGLMKNTWDGIRTSTHSTIHPIEGALYLFIPELNTTQGEELFSSCISTSSVVRSESMTFSKKSAKRLLTLISSVAGLFSNDISLGQPRLLRLAEKNWKNLLGFSDISDSTNLL